MLFEQKLHTIATSTREITSWTTLITTFATDINLMRIKLTGIKHEILRQKKGIVKIHRYSNRSVDGGYVIKTGFPFSSWTTLKCHTIIGCTLCTLCTHLQPSKCHLITHKDHYRKMRSRSLVMCWHTVIGRNRDRFEFSREFEQ